MPIDKYPYPQVTYYTALRKFTIEIHRGNIHPLYPY